LETAGALACDQLRHRRALLDADVSCQNRETSTSPLTAERRFRISQSGPSLSVAGAVAAGPIRVYSGEATRQLSGRSRDGLSSRLTRPAEPGRKITLSQKDFFRKFSLPLSFAPMSPHASVPGSKTQLARTRHVRDHCGVSVAFSLRISSHISQCCSLYQWRSPKDNPSSSLLRLSLRRQFLNGCSRLGSRCASICPDCRSRHRSRLSGPPPGGSPRRA